MSKTRYPALVHTYLGHKTSHQNTYIWSYGGSPLSLYCRQTKCCQIPFTRDSAWRSPCPPSCLCLSQCWCFNRSKWWCCIPALCLSLSLIWTSRRIISIKSQRWIQRLSCWVRDGLTKTSCAVLLDFVQITVICFVRPSLTNYHNDHMHDNINRKQGKKKLCKSVQSKRN